MTHSLLLASAIVLVPLVIGIVLLSIHYGRLNRHCINDRCGDQLVNEWIPLCASCRLAAKWGAALAFVVAFSIKIGPSFPWEAWTKALLQRIFGG